MKKELIRQLTLLLIGVALLIASMHTVAATPPAAGTGLLNQTQSMGATSEAVRIATLLTVLSIGPALIMSMTAFIRIVIVLSMIRHAFGMPETPPTPVLICLALFLTVFAMLPTFEQLNHDALQPFMHGTLTLDQALDRSTAPMRDFMLRQVHSNELQLMHELSHKAMPASADEVSLLQLTPAFILNELRVAFQIGFVILLPFLLIDLVVSSVLLSLGMLMVPPATISLPLKVLMFVLVDGWGLILQGVLHSFK
ncbi:flagellar type III secretion system pore protein FliP [Dyella sp.]|uniref:flagellar type III secretion system pore protein FliP n=1 Tax=Dyella sp. TaxID=1869338 RepID=UPI002FDB575E